MFNLLIAFVQRYALVISLTICIILSLISFVKYQTIFFVKSFSCRVLSILYDCYFSCILDSLLHYEKRMVLFFKKFLINMIFSR